MAFINAAGLKTRVQAMLKQFNLADVAAAFDVLIADGAEAGMNEVISAFLARGLTSEQAGSWARGMEFSTDLGLFWVFTEAAALHDFPDTWINKLDRRAELKTVFLADTNGVPIVPLTDPAILCGTIQQSPLDNFTIPGSRSRDGAGEWKPT